MEMTASRAGSKHILHSKGLLSSSSPEGGFVDLLLLALASEAIFYTYSQTQFNLQETPNDLSLRASMVSIKMKLLIV
uniref:Uncharacterized protein n=1 Tax=Lepeophtheirus salmonis TaxID=72036 RepID=A0A0K2VB72_LEPSM